MDDLISNLISNYDFQVKKIGRCRGAIGIFCQGEMYTLREFNGSERHLKFEKQLLENMSEQSDLYFDEIVADRDGELLSQDMYGKKYVARKSYQSKDFDIKNPGNILKGARILGLLHKHFEMGIPDGVNLGEFFHKETMSKPLTVEFERKNRELKRTKNFIIRKNNRNRFESMARESFDDFYNDGYKVCEMARSGEIANYVSESVKKEKLIHSDYNYHNILFPDKGRPYFVTNFDRVKIGIQIRDLYDYLRKTMEKYKWDEKTGYGIIEEYGKVINLTKDDITYLKIKVMYPEKYWKILNHYNNNNKFWLPDKDTAKLIKAVSERKLRINFANRILM